MSLNIPTIDCSQDDAGVLFEQLREKLSPHGDVVSEAGRQRTIELFGQPLTPQEVVARICADVQSGGLQSLLDYTTKLDGKKLSTETMRVSADEFREAHAQAEPNYLATIRRIRGNVREFQDAVLPQDASVVREEGEARIELRQRHLPQAT